MEKNGRLKVLSTTAMIDDLVARVGGERVDHQTLIVGDLDPHSYELVKGDDEAFAFADLVFCNGLGLEHGASLTYQLKAHPSACALGDRIFAKEPANRIEVDDQVDPHIWMDISLMMQGALEIVDVLAERDPEGAQYYRERGRAYLFEMEQAHREVVEVFQCVPTSKRYIVTSHDAFRYFVKAYLSEPDERLNGSWCERLSAPEGLAPDGQISSMHIKKVIDHIVKYRIGTVFPESNVNRDALNKIVSSCAKQGHVVEISEDVLYGDTMEGAGKMTSSYLEMIRHNAKTIARTFHE